MATRKRHPHLVCEDKDAARVAAARCKAMRLHQLEPMETNWKPEFGYGIAYRCSNCGTWRLDTYSPVTHELLVRSYDSPPEYESLGAQSQTAWRHEYVDSLDPKFIAREEGVPSHRAPGQRQSYPDVGRRATRKRK